MKHFYYFFKGLNFCPPPWIRHILSNFICFDKKMDMRLHDFHVHFEIVCEEQILLNFFRRSKEKQVIDRKQIT